MVADLNINTFNTIKLATFNQLIGLSMINNLKYRRCGSGTASNYQLRSEYAPAAQ